MSVFDDLVGQEGVVETLRGAVASASERLEGGRGTAMTHAWLFTGPPGSGRSNAARAFAAALQCESGGCGACHACRTALSGAHPDVSLVRTDGLSIDVAEVRDQVRLAAMRPSEGRWQVVVVEDADRLTEKAADALLKSLEEPPPRTVWMLCAPTSEDVIVTIRSRSRQVVLRTPPAEAIAAMLARRDGIDPGRALEAARASQGHVGRARALATDEAARKRRADVLAIPGSLTSIGACLDAAATISGTAQAQADEVAERLEESEREALRMEFGVEERGRRPAGYAGRLASLEKEQKRRRTRIARDSIDGVLLQLLAYYRDVLATQTAEGAALVNADVQREVATVATTFSPEETLARMDAILTCREALDANAAPQLALENLMLGLRG
ncbi:DNA polymerase-3 subunit delta' [Mumia flava]|uniref:DNA polymerase III subunit delta' n=1 Tax=Mumia flava TaxID=1348852 RepID=A0A0B2BF90_9ACTN|nr:DNA polymerase III subunit delta' [Mumia flava]PJJ57351.1 DNA polymerase-3 subunit delta' [Mumia flava]